MEYLAVGKARSEARPGSSAIATDIDTIFRSDIELTCGVVDLKRPDRYGASTSRYRSKIATDVRPVGSAIDRFENVASGAEIAEHGVSSRRSSRVNLKVLNGRTCGEACIHCGPGGAVVGSDIDVCGAEAAA